MPSLFVETEVFPQHADVIELNDVVYSKYILSLDSLVLDFVQQRMEGKVKLLAVNPSDKSDFQQMDEATFQVNELDFPHIFSEVSVWSGLDAGPMSLERILGALFSSKQLKIISTWT